MEVISLFAIHIYSDQVIDECTFNYRLRGIELDCWNFLELELVINKKKRLGKISNLKAKIFFY